MASFLDLFDDNSNIDRQLERERRFGPCDDDPETTCPFVGMMPDESDHEDGSPLDFASANERRRGVNIGMRFVRR